MFKLNTCQLTNEFNTQGRVVRKSINVNPGLKGNCSIIFFLLNNVFSNLPFGVVWDYYSLKLQGKQSKQNTASKSYKTDIKIFANPGFA